MPNSSTVMFPRRVSFDLTHNIVYTLPTIEDCKKAAKQLHREEWQRRSLNEDILSEDIIAEIQEEYSRDSEEDDLDAIIPVKSCLKKPPTVTSSSCINKKDKKSNHHKKSKRNSNTSAQTISVN